MWALFGQISPSGSGRAGACAVAAGPAGLTRRILRRGMPYGPPVPDHAMATDGTAGAADADRGLHFLCYQTSIIDQFEFIVRNWLNSPTGPRGGGIDLVVGQNGGAARSCFLATSTGAVREVRAEQAFVVPTGGEYLFSPSIDALTMLCALGSGDG